MAFSISWRSSDMRRHRAFTLVELLVALTIIGVLAALLFPVMGAVKERSRKGRCTSNLRQLYGGLTMYAGDHDGLLPPYRSRAESEWAGGPQWPEGAALAASMEPYVRSEEVWFCPSDRFAGTNTPRWTTETGSVNHAYTSFMTGIRWEAWVVRARQKAPRRGSVELTSETLLLTDYIWATRVVSANYSHSKKFNYLWGDGSVREPAPTARP